MKILIIGAGNMGLTYTKSFLSAHIIRPSDIYLFNRTKAKLEQAQKEFFVQNIFTDAEDYISLADIIIIAVKPQDSTALYPLITKYLTPNQLVLSVMAGVKLATISEALGIKKILRAMPNLPSQIGLGMTAFTASEEVSKQELLTIQNLLSTTGRVVYFEEESRIDATTAVSGSGPAYVFFLMNVMMKAAKEIGFSDSEAELLVWQTFNGAVQLQNKSNLSCNEWIEKVSSKGGTTEAAFKVFHQTAIEQHLTEGIKAAFSRAVELSGS
jgi:pyrroline-5-carboxylate reductase